jgi:hypothetical protein
MRRPQWIVAKDDPVKCAVYANDNSLMDAWGWKQFKSIANRQKKFTRKVNQAKLRTAPKFKNEYQVPRNYAKAVHLDKTNSISKWQKAIDHELQQIYKYNMFINLSHHTSERYHKTIRRFGFILFLMLNMMHVTKHN